MRDKRPEQQRTLSLSRALKEQEEIYNYLKDEMEAGLQTEADYWNSLDCDDQEQDA